MQAAHHVEKQVEGKIKEMEDMSSSEVCLIFLSYFVAAFHFSFPFPSRRPRRACLCVCVPPSVVRLSVCLRVSCPTFSSSLIISSVCGRCLLLSLSPALSMVF